MQGTHGKSLLGSLLTSTLITSLLDTEWLAVLPSLVLQACLRERTTSYFVLVDRLAC